VLESQSRALKTRMIPKKLEPNNYLLGWRSGSGKVGQKCENIPRLWRHPHKTQTRIKKFFFNLLKDLPNPQKVWTLLLFYRVASYAEIVQDNIRSFAVFKGLWHRFRWSVAVCSSALLRTYYRKAYSLHPSSMRLYSRYCDAYSLKRLPESFFKALNCLIDISLCGDYLFQSKGFLFRKTNIFVCLNLQQQPLPTKA